MINLNGNSSSSRQVTFITHPSIQSKAFASYLSETLVAPVVLQILINRWRSVWQKIL